MAGGYFGDYLGISAHAAKVYPVWTDNRDGIARAYVSAYVLADPTDPNGVSAGAAYSDFTTPNTIELTWTDPTTLVDGTPISSGDFTIEISRDGTPLTSVAGGTEAYTDNGLTDGQLYEYELITKLTLNDSLSLPVNLSWYAGGSPMPSAPQNLAVTADTADADLTWDDPTTQSDGTPLDDLDSIRVYRNGTWIANVDPGVGTYTDTPPPGFTYTYTVKALDNETPANESAASNAVEIYVGSTPDFLVWVGPDAGSSAAASGDSIAAALAANGESVFLTNDLFEFGSNLDVYEGVFVVLGIFSNNHVIDATAPEGPALENYLQNGGYLYLEGGDCFNYDPEQGGYNIRPWFDLNDGPDGGSDVSGLIGAGDLNGFVFPYSGENNFMDQLQPINSNAIWKNDATDSTHGVFNTSYGLGRAIGAVAEFGGMDNSSLSPAELLRKLEEKRANMIVRESGSKPQVERRRNENFVKKYYPAQKNVNANQNETFKLGDGGVEILANNKTDLMAAYLGMFRASAGPPVIAVSPTSLTDTLLVNGTNSLSFDVANDGGSLAGPLTYNITLGTFAGWITFSPTSGVLGANQSETIVVDLDAAGLPTGSYTAVLEVTSDDPVTPQVDVTVTLVVNDAPIVSFSPDSMSFTLDPSVQDSAEMWIFNTGAGPLEYTLEAVIGGSSLKPAHAKLPNGMVKEEMRADIKRRTANRGVANATEESRRNASSGIGVPPAVISGEEVFGDASSSFSGTNRDRGNVFGITTTTTLLEYKQYLNIPTDTEIYFFVYEGAAATGDFSLINQVYFPSSGTGEGFYTSGPTNVLLQAGKFYYIGASWGASSVSYFRGGPAGPIPASFGTLESGVAGTTAGFPPNPGTINSTWSGFSAYYCTINTGAGFLSVAPDAGTVVSGDSSSAMVRVNSENLLGGVYEGSIQINSNDPVSPAVKMPVTLTVNGLAVISTSPDSLQFSELLAGETETLQVEVANIGNGPLTVSNIASTNAAFSPTPTSLVIAPFSAEMVDVVFAPTAAGSFDGYLELTSDDPSTPVDTVVLSGSAIDAPIASISPDSFDVTLAIGSTATDTLVISNDGSTPLEFNVSVEFASAANMKVEVLGQPKNDNQMVIASGKPLPLVALNQTQFAVAMNASGEPDFEAPSFAAGAGNENDPAPSIAGEEVFGSNASSFGPSGLRGRGNLFTVTSSTTLSEHRLYLNPTAATKMHFVVAESDAQVGTYTTISVAELTKKTAKAGTAPVLLMFSCKLANSI
ncbi:MAG: choice-of-anchor D domain-containing protein [Calditrichaeota bacterium]|nr:choice-of-anchor D domain-containing protein [Calditrichota bacterium]